MQYCQLFHWVFASVRHGSSRTSLYLGWDFNVGLRWWLEQNGHVGCGFIHTYILCSAFTRLLVIIYTSRNSSVGRALDWRSKGPWFNPGFRQSLILVAGTFFVEDLEFLKLGGCGRKRKQLFDFGIEESFKLHFVRVVCVVFEVNCWVSHSF